MKNGWISVNGKTVTDLGTKIDPEKDVVELSKHVEAIRKNYTYLVFHKPRGIVTNCPEEGETEIRDVLPP